MTWSGSTLTSSSNLTPAGAQMPTSLAKGRKRLALEGMKPQGALAQGASQEGVAVFHVA